MKTITILKNEIMNHPESKMDAEFWTKKKEIQVGTKVLVNKNIYGNDCESFVGLTGIIIGHKKNDWYKVILDTQTTWGKKFNFHIDEIENI
jgi:hypothetical protein